MATRIGTNPEHNITGMSSKKEPEIDSHKSNNNAKERLGTMGTDENNGLFDTFTRERKVKQTQTQNN